MSIRTLLSKLWFSSINPGMAVAVVALALSSLTSCADTAQSRDLENIKAQLKANPDYATKGPGDPLQRAAALGDTEGAELLLVHGAEVNGRAINGYTPLFEAVMHYPKLMGNNKKMVELLLAHGADVNEMKGAGSTALCCVAKRGNTDLAELLLAHGADVEAKDRFGETPLHLAADDYGRQVADGGKDMSELLLAHGADVNAKDGRGRTPLHWVAVKGTAELLLAHGADINARDDDGRTPLHAAAEYGRTEVAALLLAHGADAYAKAKNGDTALHLAEVNAKEDVAKLLGGSAVGYLRQIAQNYSVYISMGERGSESALVNALHAYGNAEMAADYLNCGNMVLAQAAREWARQHHYTIRTASGGGSALRWGGK